MTEDKITTLNKRLKEILEKFEAFKKAGMDEDILKTYIKAKMKISDKAVEKFLKTFDDFYNGLVKKAIIEELEKWAKNH